mgnify:FL=1
MKILGIGVDIINNKRIKFSIRKKDFIKRIFSQNEIKFSKKIKLKTNYFAKRFAAKEALSKALGIGFRNNLNFKDIEILNDKLGKPYYFKSKKITNIVNKKFKTKRYNLFLSITDEKDYSIAFTILQSQ